MKPRPISIASTRVPDGGRSPDRLDESKCSISELGLLHPITVDRQRGLLAGRHRLEACRQLGGRTIPAHVVTLDALRAELVTIEENVTTTPLSELERPQQLAPQKEVYEALYPATRSDRVRSGPERGKKSERTRGAVAFSQVAAKQLGVGRRTGELR